MQSTIARVAPPTVLQRHRQPVAARMRALLAPYRGGVYDLVEYHLGWRDGEGRPCDGHDGKMMRPALCLAAAAAFDTEDCALNAAAALELLHAFSLVHDDIEDGDELRRHRPTLWAAHGVPLALNAGDSLFALAHRALDESVASLPPARTLQARRIFDDACLRMIEGQHLDLQFESREEVSLDEYLAMVRRKTGALIGASLALGAVCAGAEEQDVETLRDAGVEIGVAFQAVDDGLSVWGDAAVTGKAAGNDAGRGKKSLPAVLARERGLPVEAPAVREAVRSEAQRHASSAREAIRSTGARAEAVAELEQLIAFTLSREC